MALVDPSGLEPPPQSSPRLNWSTGPIFHGESRFEPSWAHRGIGVNSINTAKYAYFHLRLL